jgi:hypothetical protein
VFERFFVMVLFGMQQGRIREAKQSQ